MAYVAEISDRLQVLAHGRPGHIIDRLIAERGGRLVAHPAWPVMRPFLYATLKYGAAVRMADAIGTMSGHEAFRHLSDILEARHPVARPRSGSRKKAASCWLPTTPPASPTAWRCMIS